MTRIISRAILRAIRLYQIVGRDLLLSLVPVRCSCKFQPSCSEYCEEAVHTFGPLRGSWYGIRRVMRCFFWSRSRYDMV